MLDRARDGDKDDKCLGFLRMGIAPNMVATKHQTKCTVQHDFVYFVFVFTLFQISNQKAPFLSIPLIVSKCSLFSFAKRCIHLEKITGVGEFCVSGNAIMMLERFLMEM